MNNSTASKSFHNTSPLTDKHSNLTSINSLQEIVKADPSSNNLTSLALAYFHNEQYDLAAQTYEQALKSDPSNAALKEMFEKSSMNFHSEVNVPIPEIYYFEKDKLLAKSEVKQGSIPKDPLPNVNGEKTSEVKMVLGTGIGVVSTAFMEVSMKLWGSITGVSGKIWTNWYRKPLFLGILTLAYMRERLNKYNLHQTYPKGVLIGFQPEGQTPPEGVQYYRTADGSWNNLSDPKEGAAGTRLARNIKLDAIRVESGDELLTPNPREISRRLFTRGEKMKEVPFLNMLAACWIQFQNADWINHGEPLLKDVIEVPLAEDDPARKKYNIDRMLVPKTQPDPTRREGKEDASASFINEVTHWWDGSQIYGSDQVTVDKLRSGIDGKIKVNDDGLLPLDNKGIEQTGFIRNWWVGMSMLHTLFTREHNSICDHLKKHYPAWDDTRLFNVARLVNAAIMAKIHSDEWTPAILPNQGLDMGLNANWYGILTKVFEKSKAHPKTVSDINVRNPELGGVVGNPINKHGVAYGFSEEFVEVYRLHSLLPETLHLKNNKTDETIMDIPFSKTRQAGAGKLTKQVSMADLFYSFGNQHPGQLVLNNYPKFMQELSIPFNPVFDMGAIDILRCRERGVPRYNEFRRQLGLKPITKVEDLTDDASLVKEIKDIYGSDDAAVEKIDLMVGTLGEGHRPYGFGFGETMFQIFILNATRRLQADRFYTDCYTPAYYTKEGLDWIDQADLKSVILRHYPELKNSGLANVKNAFEPWDKDLPLKPERHPLTQW